MEEKLSTRPHRHLGRLLVAFLTILTVLVSLLPALAQTTPTAAIDVEKYISVDGVTWQDADGLPGPTVPLAGQVAFRFVVTNTGSVSLTNLTLTDTVYDLQTCTLPATLEPGSFFECTLTAQPVQAGQHTNTAVVTALYQGQSVTDSDGANYFGGDRPAIDIEKYVMTDGATWADVDAAPGPQVIVGSNVSFRFVITNTGTVPLTALTLTDTTLATTTCVLPATLEPAASVECVVGPVPAVEGQHTNTATVTASFNGVSVTDSDTASYLGGDTALPVTIIIEGPVQIINANIVTIYDIDIEINADDPILNVIQIGDFIRVEGDTALDDDQQNLVVIAIFVVIVDVDVVVNVDGEVWRDEGDCSNGPPPWAPANGWRRRCEGGGRGHDDDDD